jgi:hypothetical protein
MSTAARLAKIEKLFPAPPAKRELLPWQSWIGNVHHFTIGGHEYSADWCKVAWDSYFDDTYDGNRFLGGEKVIRRLKPESQAWLGKAARLWLDEKTVVQAIEAIGWRPGMRPSDESVKEALAKGE